MEVLNSCNYIVRSENEACIRAPYSYDYIKTDGDYSLYKSGKGVSLTYFYDYVISTETFDRFDPLTRETALIVSDLVSIPFELEETNNVLIEGDIITVNEDCEYITLRPESIEPGQISIFMSGLSSSTVDNWHYRNAVAF